MAEAEIKDLGRADTPDGGVIRLSQWPEGFVLWYHGEIVWRSWEWPRREASKVTITLDASGVREMIEREAHAASIARERERRSLGNPFRP